MGVGRSLLANVKEVLAARGAKTLDVRVHPQNSRALRFYLRNGFFASSGGELLSERSLSVSLESGKQAGALAPGSCGRGRDEPIQGAVDEEFRPA